MADLSITKQSYWDYEKLRVSLTEIVVRDEQGRVFAIVTHEPRYPWFVHFISGSNPGVKCKTHAEAMALIEARYRDPEIPSGRRRGRPRHLTDAQAREARAMWNDRPAGWSIRALAHIFDTTPSVINAAIERRGAYSKT
jgi:hypothetical protein